MNSHAVLYTIYQPKKSDVLLPSHTLPSFPQVRDPSVRARASRSESEQLERVRALDARPVRHGPPGDAVDRLEVLHDAPPAPALAHVHVQRREERVVRAEQHPPAARVPLPISALAPDPSVSLGVTRSDLRPAVRRREARRAPDGVGDERELCGPVGDGVEVEPAEVPARVVPQTRGDGGVVRDAGREARGELREGAACVGEEDAEARVAVEDAREDEARDGLQR